MKVSPASADEFVRHPGPVRAVLLFGDDEGLIRERSSELLRTLLGPQPDSFRLTDLGPETTAMLSAEARTGSLLGGRRVIRVRDAGDLLAGVIGELLQAELPTVLVLLAPELPGRSKLRALVEAAPAGAAIACYVEDAKQRAKHIRDLVSAARVRIDPSAVAWLADQLEGGRALLRGEVEKLTLAAGPGGLITLDLAKEAAALVGGASLDDALFASLAADNRAADRALGRAFAEGLEPIAALRAASAVVQQLARCRALVDAGMPVGAAMAALRPPIFFRNRDRFAAAVRRWTRTRLEAAASALHSAERIGKSTGLPDAVVAAHAILKLSDA